MDYGVEFGRRMDDCFSHFEVVIETWGGIRDAMQIPCVWTESE
jgi:hypothetical protein